MLIASTETSLFLLAHSVHCICVAYTNICLCSRTMKDVSINRSEGRVSTQMAKSSIRDSQLDHMFKFPSNLEKQSKYMIDWNHQSSSDKSISILNRMIEQCTLGYCYHAISTITLWQNESEDMSPIRSALTLHFLLDTAKDWSCCYAFWNLQKVYCRVPFIKNLLLLLNSAFYGTHNFCVLQSGLAELTF